MNNKSSIIRYAVIALIIALLAILIIYINNKKSEVELSSKYIEVKNYKVNEYIPTYVSDNDMAKIYYNNFVTAIIEDPEHSYELLDEEYKNIKYPTYQIYYDDFLSNFDINLTISKFYKVHRNGYLYFGVYNSDDILFIFKTKGVMQYSVYLDDYTIEIGD